MFTKETQNLQLNHYLDQGVEESQLGNTSQAAIETLSALELFVTQKRSQSQILDWNEIFNLQNDLRTIERGIINDKARVLECIEKVREMIC